MTRILLVALLLAAPLAAAQERAPQPDAMVHMDLSSQPPRYVPDEVVLVPGGTLQLMLFGKGESHSISLDDGAAAAIVPAGAQDGFYERAAQLAAPRAPGDYPFHDASSGARGVLKVRAPALIGVRENGYDLHFAPERIEVAPGATVTFRANGSFAHTLTSATGAWTEVALEPGQSGSFVAPAAPGEYAFFCRYHKDGGMSGVLVVVGSTPTTPAPENEPARPVPQGSFGAGLAILLLAGLAARRRA